MPEGKIEFDDLGRSVAGARFGVGGHVSRDLTAGVGSDAPLGSSRLAAEGSGYGRLMLWTILIILAIIALVLFILGRRAV